MRSSSVFCKILISVLAFQLACATLTSESSATTKSLAPTLGSLYRSARDGYRYGRNSGCMKCDGGYNNRYDDRDMRDMRERDMRDMRDRDMRYMNDNYRMGVGGSKANGIFGYWNGMGSINDDKNWYYRPENVDERFRNGYDDRYSSNAPQMQQQMQSQMNPNMYMNPNMMMNNRYDDRYNNRYENRYDNQYNNPMMSSSMAGGYYDNRYDMNRMGMGGYDSRGGSNYEQRPTGGRPMTDLGYRGNGYDNLDPKYHEYMMRIKGYGGGSGSNYGDRGMGMNMGHNMDGGGYYDNKNFRPWDETYSRPSQNHPLPTPPQPPNHPAHYEKDPSSSSNANSNSSGSWGYINNGHRDSNKAHTDHRDNDRDNNHRDKDRQQSTSYGAHTRPLGATSYLLDRDSSSPASSGDFIRDDKTEDNHSSKTNNGSSNTKIDDDEKP